MRILLTRPEPDASACRAQLEALGHEVTTAPLLNIELGPIGTGTLQGAGGIVVTSRNGLRALEASQAIDAARKLPLLAVGPGTAELARQIGFGDITAASGTGEALLPVLLEHARNNPHPFLFVRGDEISFDLAAACAGEGVPLRSIIAYRAVEAAGFPAAARKRLAAGDLDAVILMSPRTGRIFVRLAGEEGVAEQCANLVFFSLSRNVAATLEPLGPSRVEIAESPNSSAMLTAVTRVATLWSGVMR